MVKTEIKSSDEKHWRKNKSKKKVKKKAKKKAKAKAKAKGKAKVIFFFFSSSGAQFFNSKNLFNKEKLSDDAAEMHLFLCPLSYANIAFIINFYPQPTGALMLKSLGPL